jgi:hypothetical protein
MTRTRRRARRSTVVLSLAFLVVLTVYLLVRPTPKASPRFVTVIPSPAATKTLAPARQTTAPTRSESPTMSAPTTRTPSPMSTPNGTTPPTPTAAPTTTRGAVSTASPSKAPMALQPSSTSSPLTPALTPTP